MRTFLATLTLSLACFCVGAQSVQQADAALIRSLLTSMFDKPGAKLDVNPIVVANAHAIASWTQGDMGGRALLRKDKGKWTLVACAGDGLKEEQTLQQTGMPKADATSLARQLASAEAAIPQERRKRFSLFGPMTDAAAAHKPGAHSSH